MTGVAGVGGVSVGTSGFGVCPSLVGSGGGVRIVVSPPDGGCVVVVVSPSGQSSSWDEVPSRNCRRPVKPTSARTPPASTHSVGGPAVSRGAPLHASSLQMEQYSILTPRCSFALPYAIWHGSVLPPSSWQPRYVIVSPFSTKRKGKDR
uniref:Uncharacterized protein n=1 Tax=Anopheles farauti TaxID=69004 RepID=A0A182QXG5_9DIPT